MCKRASSMGGRQAAKKFSRVSTKDTLLIICFSLPNVSRSLDLPIFISLFNHLFSIVSFIHLGLLYLQLHSLFHSYEVSEYSMCGSS